MKNESDKLHVTEETGGTDTIPPLASIKIINVASDSITISVSASDYESGLATSGTYSYYINTEGTARSTGTSNTYTYTGLTPDTQYTVKVIVKDQAGNEKKVTNSATTLIKLPEQAGERFSTTGTYNDGEKTAVIPGGFTVSGLSSECYIDEGLVIYLIPEGTTIDWTNPTEVDTAQRTYDQFVWIPIKNTTDANAQDINDMYICQAKTGSNGNCNITVQNGVAKCTTHNSTQMAGRLYATSIGESFEQGYTEVYTPNTGLREPDVVITYPDDADGDSTNLDQLSSILGTTGYDTTENFKQSLQNEYNQIVKSVYTNQGFYIGRYETSGMENSNTNVTVKSVAGTNTGISTVTWYRMYAQQVKYAENKGLTSVKSSMIQGAAYDQVMKFVENGTRPDGQPYNIKTYGNVGHYINYYGEPWQTGGRDYEINYTGTTPYNDCVKNIYDLEGNVYTWTTEANSTYYSVGRGRLLRRPQPFSQLPQRLLSVLHRHQLWFVSPALRSSVS